MIGVGLASLIISSLLAITSIYGIIFFGATSVREAGQGRNPAALSDFRCVLFFCVKEDLWPNFSVFKIKRSLFACSYLSGANAFGFV